MPATFQDAIQYTKDMEISYIWIDFLCIMQDSPEDWRTEAALMYKVYAQSLCNIAASYASNERSLNTGLFYTLTPDDIVTLSVMYKFRTKKEYQGLYGISLKSNHIIDDSEYAIYGRAWVLQERLLSPRTIHFSKQLIWECREKRASESFPMGLSLISRNGSRDSNFSRDWRLSLRVDGCEFWEDTVGRYLKSSLTYPSDQLVALGAIAREYETELDDVYFAGLWKKELPLNLLWKIRRSCQFCLRENTYRCSTWSWTSLEICYPAEVQFPRTNVQALVEVLEAKVSSPPGRAHTEYFAGHIWLKGKLYPVVSKDSYEWRCHDYNYHGCSFNTGRITDFDVVSFLDIKIQESEDSRLYLIPIESRVLGKFIECLILRSTLTGSMEFERVGVLCFTPTCFDKDDEQLRPIIEWAGAKDPLSRGRDTITIF
ncbi:hypothetical protein BHYA_0170g00300 [Botrytis hyacinthi]|uniref:Heterokaryon incompatibility domain-containing protein n=1 Tax=Botrytis hyacinthi TaxID=278943 RepID=A0A4Z1GN91_9HELO|nr:hypothetical protein BHYA_0170g00300 [Botrytis hyacinthi]